MYLFSEVDRERWARRRAESECDVAYNEHDATINYEQRTTEAFEESTLQMALNELVGNPSLLS
jgi:hypothetical protein